MVASCRIPDVPDTLQLQAGRAEGGPTGVQVMLQGRGKVR